MPMHAHVHTHTPLWKLTFNSLQFFFFFFHCFPTFTEYLLSNFLAVGQSFYLSFMCLAPYASLTLLATWIHPSLQRKLHHPFFLVTQWMRHYVHPSSFSKNKDVPHLLVEIKGSSVSLLRTHPFYFSTSILSLTKTQYPYLWKGNTTSTS